MKIERILLYGSETWTITKTFENKIDGCYIRLIRILYLLDFKYLMARQHT